MDVRKTFTDAGYIAVGLGVMGFQQAQIRGRELQEHVQSAGDCITNRARTLAGPGRYARPQPRQHAPRGARRRRRHGQPDRVPRAGPRGRGSTTRVEPVVVQVQATRRASCPSASRRRSSRSAALVPRAFTERRLSRDRRSLRARVTAPSRRPRRLRRERGFATSAR